MSRTSLGRSSASDLVPMTDNNNNNSAGALNGSFSVSYAKRTSPPNDYHSPSSLVGNSGARHNSVGGGGLATPTGNAATSDAALRQHTPSPYPLFPGGVSLSPNTTSVITQHRRRTNHATPNGATPMTVGGGGLQSSAGHRTLFARPVTVGNNGISTSPNGTDGSPTAAEAAEKQRSQSGSIRSAARVGGSLGMVVGGGGSGRLGSGPGGSAGSMPDNGPSTRPPTAVASLLNTTSHNTSLNSHNASFADGLRPPSSIGTAPRTTGLFAGNYTSSRGGGLNASVLSDTHHHAVGAVDLRPTTSTPSSSTSPLHQQQSTATPVVTRGDTSSFASPVFRGDVTPTHRQSSVSSTGSRTSGSKRTRRESKNADLTEGGRLGGGNTPSPPSADEDVSPIPLRSGKSKTQKEDNDDNEYDVRYDEEGSNARDIRSTSTTYTVRGMMDGMRIQRSASSTAWPGRNSSSAGFATPTGGQSSAQDHRARHRPAPLEEIALEQQRTHAAVTSSVQGGRGGNLNYEDDSSDDETGSHLRRRQVGPRAEGSSDALEICYGGQSPSVSQSRRVIGGGGNTSRLAGQHAPPTRHQHVDPAMTNNGGDSSMGHPVDTTNTNTTATTTSSGVSSPTFRQHHHHGGLESPRSTDSIGMRQYVTFGSSYRSSKEVSPSAHGRKNSTHRQSRRQSVAASSGYHPTISDDHLAKNPYTSSIFSQDVQDSQASSTGGFCIKTNIDAYNAHTAGGGTASSANGMGAAERSVSRQSNAPGRPPKSDMPPSGPRHNRKGGSELGSHASPAFQRPSVGSIMGLGGGLQRASTASSSFLNMPSNFHPSNLRHSMASTYGAHHNDNSSMSGGDDGGGITAYFEHKYLMEFDDIKVLGAGSFGKVILVEERATGHHFAVKISAPVQSVRQEDKLKQERNVLFAIRGTPHCMSINDAWIEGAKDHPQLYLQTTWYERGSLGKMIQNRRETDTPWKEEEVLCFLGQMAIALEGIHAVNIVHVDFKPDNVLVDADYNFHLGDFGCALVLEDETQRPYSLKNNFLVAASQQRPSGELHTHGGSGFNNNTFERGSMNFGLDSHLSQHTNMGPPGPSIPVSAACTPHSPAPNMYMHPRHHHNATVFSTPSSTCLKPTTTNTSTNSLPTHLLNNPHIGLLPTSMHNNVGGGDVNNNHVHHDSDSVADRDSGTSMSMSVCSHDAGDGRYTSTDMQNDKQHYKAGDIFSFGMSLYEIMSGQEPPRDKAHYEIRHRTELDELLQRGYSESLVSLVLTMLNADPLFRPTARDILASPMLQPSARTTEVMQGAAKILQSLPSVLPVAHARTHLPTRRLVPAISTMSGAQGGFLHGSDSMMGFEHLSKNGGAGGGFISSNVPASACATPTLRPAETPHQAHERRLAFTNASSGNLTRKDNRINFTNAESGGGSSVGGGGGGGRSSIVTRGLADTFSSSVDGTHRNRSSTATETVASRIGSAPLSSRHESSPMTTAHLHPNGDSPDILGATMGANGVPIGSQHPNYNESAVGSPYNFSRPPPIQTLDGQGGATFGNGGSSYSSPPINTARTAVGDGGGSVEHASPPYPNPCDNTIGPNSTPNYSQHHQPHNKPYHPHHSGYTNNDSRGRCSADQQYPYSSSPHKMGDGVSPNPTDVSAITQVSGALHPHHQHGTTNLVDHDVSSEGSTEISSDDDSMFDVEVCDIRPNGTAKKGGGFGGGNQEDVDSTPSSPLDGLLTPCERVELRYHRCCLEVAQYNLGLLNRALEGVVPPARMRYIQWSRQRAEVKRLRRQARKAAANKGNNPNHHQHNHVAESGDRTPCTMGQRLFRSSSNVRITPTASGTLFGGTSLARWGSDSMDGIIGRGTVNHVTTGAGNASSANGGGGMCGVADSYATQNVGITFTDEASPTIRRPGHIVSIIITRQNKHLPYRVGKAIPHRISLTLTNTAARPFIAIHNQYQ